MYLSNMLPNSISQRTGRAGLIIQKNSPHILFGVGLGAIITSTILACKATLKLDKTLDQAKTEIEDTKSLYKDEPTAPETQREYYKDMSYVYTKSMLKLARLYGPSIVVGSLGVGALTGSHVQMTKRNGALTVTLAAVSKAYTEYRDRVAGELGEDREHALHHGFTEETVEIDGKKELVAVKDPNNWSPYSVIFDELNPNYKKNSELNRNFIQAQQNYMNHLLRSRGHVFLNDVLDHLGFERTSAGAVVGWLTDGDGDCYIDFGIFEAYNSRFINNLERSVVLDFNVDGVIYDKI